MRAVPTTCLLLACAACVPQAEVQRVLVLDEVDGDYAVVERSVPELTDLTRLDGDLGTGFRGGVIALEAYREGGRLDIGWRSEGEVGVPLDEDGLVLWSFYHQLAGARSELAVAGFDPEPLFPVSIAYNPVSFLDFSAFENAAYASSLHTFILFPDLVTKGVPLATNRGVVRHEFGHCWFHWLTTGDMREQPPYFSSALPVIDQVSALNEGFADSVATLLLDDPYFFEASLDMPSRDVRGAWVADDSVYPTGEETLLEGYDPYPLGTVYASLAWDIRSASTSELALGWVVDAVEAWAAEGVWSDTDRYAVLLVEQAQADPVAGVAACDALSARFPHVDPPDACAD